MATSKKFNAEQGISVGTGAINLVDPSGNVTAATLASGATTITGNIVQSGGTSSFSGQVLTQTADAKQLALKNTLSYVKTATGTSGQNTIVVSNNTDLTVGMVAVGTGIAANATITNIAGTTITLSVNNTGTVSGNITFSAPTIYLGATAEYPLTVTGGATGTNVIWSLGQDGRFGIGGTPGVGEMLFVNGTMRVANNLQVDGTLITSADLNIVSNSTFGTNSSNTMVVNATSTFNADSTWNANVYARALVPTSSTVPTKGIYAPASNIIAYSINGVRVATTADTYHAVGELGASTNVHFYNHGSLLPTVTSYGFKNTVQYYPTAGTSTIYQNHSDGLFSDIGGATTLTVHANYVAIPTLTDITNPSTSITYNGYSTGSLTDVKIGSVRGFFGQQATVTGVDRWNLYMSGSAPNYINGRIGVGADTNSKYPNTKLNLKDSMSFVSSFTASISGMVMTVSAVASGTIEVGSFILNTSGTIPQGVYIVDQLTGTAGSTGTYTISTPLTVGSTASTYTVEGTKNRLRFTDTDTATSVHQPIGIIEWYGHDNTLVYPRTGGVITTGTKAFIHGVSANASNGASGELVFGTFDINNGDAIGAVGKIRIDAVGNLLPESNDVFDIGSSTLRWKTGYFNSIWVQETTQLGNTAGNSLEISRIRAPNSNAANLITEAYRISNGSDHTTASMRMRYMIDSTSFGNIAFLSSPEAITISGNAGEWARFVGGNLLVGTSTDDGANKLQIAGNAKIQTTVAELLIEGTNNSIGTPTASLRLKRVAARSAGVVFSDSADTEIGFIGIPYNGGATSDSIIVRTAGSERIRVRSDGVFQVGNNSGASIHLKAGVVGTTGALNWTFNTDSTVYGSLSLPYDTRTTVGLKLESASGYPISINAGTGASTSFVAFGTSGSERMRVDPDGNVVIGKITANSLFNVEAPDNVTTTYPIRIDNNANNYGSGYGAYGMSNRVNVSNPSIDYTIDIGRHLILKNANAESMRIASTGNVLIGTATDDAFNKLQVNGGVAANYFGTEVGNGTSIQLAIVGGGSRPSSTATETGYIKIALPVSWTNTMMSFEVTIFEYAGGADGDSIKLHVGGYNYSATPLWNNVFATVISGRTDKFFNVRFGHDGTKCAIYIGESTTVWDYPQVFISNFVSGYGATSTWENWATGWNISVTTTLGTITQTKALENVASYALDSDKLDGKHASEFLWNTGGTSTGSLIVSGAGTNFKTTWFADDDAGYFFQGSGRGVNVGKGLNQDVSGNTIARATSGSNLNLTSASVSIATFSGATVGNSVTTVNRLVIDETNLTSVNNLVLQNGTAEKRILLGSSGAYHFGNPTFVGVWNPANSKSYNFDLVNGHLTASNDLISTSGGVRVSSYSTTGLYPGNGDAANFTSNNVKLSSWYGIGFQAPANTSYTTGTYSHWFDARTGNTGFNGHLEIYKNTTGTSYTAGTFSISLVTTNASNPSLNFHRSGYNQASIYYNSSGQLGVNASIYSDVTYPLVVSATSMYIQHYDTDWGANRYIHSNGGLIGFLNSGAGWACYSDNSNNWTVNGNIWVGSYGDWITNVINREQNYGAIGSLVFGMYYTGSSGNAVYEGNTYAGSSIYPAGTTGATSNPGADVAIGTNVTRGATALTGTWRALGRSAVAPTAGETRCTLFIRIS